MYRNLVAKGLIFSLSIGNLTFPIRVFSLTEGLDRSASSRLSSVKERQEKIWYEEGKQKLLYCSSSSAGRCLFQQIWDFVIASVVFQ